MERCNAQLEEHDIDKFNALATDADTVAKLDAWKATMLSKIKEHIPAKGSTTGAEFA